MARPRTACHPISAATAASVTRLPRRAATEYSATTSLVASTASASGDVANRPGVSASTTPASAASGERRRQPSATAASTVAATPAASSTRSTGCPSSSRAPGQSASCAAASSTGSSQFRILSMSASTIGGPGQSPRHSAAGEAYLPSDRELFLPAPEVAAPSRRDAGAMTIAQAPPATPYHRLARTAAHRWWRPVVGTLVVLAGSMFAGLLVLCVGFVGGVVANRPEGPDGAPTFGAIGDTALVLVFLAVATPVVLLTARWIQGRPAGSVSSVVGRLR